MHSSGSGLRGDSVQLPPLQPTPSTGHSYRQRESTQYRGVTKTSGTNSGVEKFDVQFVFCDSGTKKHPKIYGFGTATSAARAFDLLTCKRALEKSRSVHTVLNSVQALGTNHPTSDYANEALLTFVYTQSRDDIIYALKQCAKRGHALEPGTLMNDLNAGLEAARAEAAEKERMGDPRQSYEATAKPNSERKRKPVGGARPPAPGTQATAARQAAAREARDAAARERDAREREREQQSQGDPLLALMQSLPGFATRDQQKQPASLGHLPPPDLSAALGGHLSAGGAQLLGSNDVSGLAALASGLLRGAPHDPDASCAAARLAAAATGGGRGAGLVGGDGGLGALSAQLSAQLPGVNGSDGGQPSQQAMLLQVLQQSQGGGGGPRRPALLKSEPVNPSAGLEGLDFLLECLRLAMAASPELSCAHDLVRIWGYLIQGKAWAGEQYNLPQWYYMGLVPHLQACLHLSGLLAFCGQLWQSGALRVMLAAFAGNLPQATVITLLQSVAAAAGPAVPRAPSPVLPALDPQQQATALVAAALEQVQQHERERAEREQQQAAALKAAAALLGGAGGVAQEGRAGGGSSNSGGPAPALLQQVLQMLGGPGSGGRGGALGGASAAAEALTSLLQPADLAKLGGEPSRAPGARGERQPQLAQLMHLLGGVAGGGRGEDGAARNAPPRHAATPPADRAAHAASAPGSGGARDGGSVSTETEPSGPATEGGAGALRQPSRPQSPQEPGEAGGDEVGVKEEPGGRDSARESGEVSNAQGSELSPVPLAKRARTHGPDGRPGLPPDFDAAVAAAAEALGANGSTVGREACGKGGAGHAFRSVRLDSIVGAPQRPGDHPFAVLAAANSLLQGAAVAAGLPVSAPVPTRPQPLKASCDLGGSVANGSVAGAAGAGPGPLAWGNKSWAPGSAAAPKLDMLHKAASVEMGPIGQQPSSAFTRFPQPSQGPPPAAAAGQAAPVPAAAAAPAQPAAAVPAGSPRA